MNLVIDANVLIKAYVPEVLSDNTDALFKKVIEGEVRLSAPDLIYPEIGNVLWKKSRFKELSASEAKEISRAIVSFPLNIEPSKSLVELAVDIAMIYNISVYDATYVALAVVCKTKVITADKKLFDIMNATTLKKHIRWLGDM